MRLTVLFLTFCLSCSPIGGGESSSGENKTDYEALFAHPECGNYEYATPITQNNGVVRKLKKGNVYCTPLDIQSDRSHDTIHDKLNMVLSDPSMDIESVDMISYIYFDDQLSSQLCRRHVRDNFTLRFFAQRNQGSKRDHASLTQLRQCMQGSFQQIDVGCDVFDDNCDTNSISTIHSKLLMLKGKKNNQEQAIIFGGSGNFSNILKYSFDDMLYMSLPIQHPLVTRNECTFKLLVSLGASPFMSMAEAKVFYKQCVKNLTTRTVPHKDIRYYLLPLEFYPYFNEMTGSIRAAKHIKAAIQVLGDDGVRDALLEALKHGAKVDLITGNEWYYLNIPKANDVTYTLDWGMQDNKKYFTHLRPLTKAGAQVRFLETNFDMPRALDNNYMHLRFIITDDEKVFTGSSHVKRGAYTQNIENQYIIENTTLVNQYHVYFQTLWDKALTYDEMPSTYVTTSFAKKYKELNARPNTP